jgi:methionine sulfoxide reductase heme-binding subunit
MTALNGIPFPWLMARASGLVAFGLLTGSVWLGLAMSTRLLGGKRQAALLRWHRTLSASALTMLVVHVGALLLDPVISFGPLAVLVPFAAPWRPIAVGLGVIAAWLSLILAVSFRLRARIGTRMWRRLHYASFLAFVLMIAHTLTAGTDMVGLTGPVVAGAAATPVIFLALVRVLMPRGAGSRPRPERNPAHPGHAARGGSAAAERASVLPITTFVSASGVVP